MKKLSHILGLVLILVGLMTFTSGLGADAHAQMNRPLYNVQCFGYFCDGIFPHDTDGPFGSNCVGDAFVDSLDPVIDSYGHLQGYLSLAHSPNNCQAAWGSFQSNSNTWKEISVCTIRPFSHAATTCRGSYFIANAYIDARMLGLEQGNGDCVYATIDLTDNKGIVKHVQSHKSFCL